jgi:hypothetical protein
MIRRDATVPAPTTASEGPSAARLGRRGLFRSAKILDLHLDRIAVVYIRQSDPQDSAAVSPERGRGMPPAAENCC